MSKPSRKIQVLLYYPQHFNRDTNNENPLFRPFLKFCEAKDISYKLVEEADKNCIKPKNPGAVKFNIFFVLVFRKLIPLFLFQNFELREQFIGKVYRVFTANYYAAEVVFTLSNSLGGFWRGYNPKARIIDYQHGLINTDQTGFFKNGKAPQHISENSKEVAVWGRNFKAMFDKDQEYYANKVHVLGYFLEQKVLNNRFQGRDKIVFTLQFMPDLGDEMNTTMLDLLKAAISQFEKLSIEKRPSIILKNHPRHNQVLDLETIFEDFDFVQVWPDDVDIDAKGILINATCFSTAAFEMAQNGVPSYFLYNRELPQGQNIFLNDYNYPLQKKESLLDFWVTYQNNPNQWIQHSKIVTEWVQNFFEPFDNERLWQLITAKISE